MEMKLSFPVGDNPRRTENKGFKLPFLCIAEISQYIDGDGRFPAAGFKEERVACLAAFFVGEQLSFFPDFDCFMKCLSLVIPKRGDKIHFIPEIINTKNMMNIPRLTPEKNTPQL